MQRWWKTLILWNNTTLNTKLSGKTQPLGQICPTPPQANLILPLQQKAKGVMGDRFILCAKPNSRYQQRENRYLEIDQAGYLKICTPKNKQAEPCKNTSRTCQKW